MGPGKGLAGWVRGLFFATSYHDNGKLPIWFTRKKNEIFNRHVKSPEGNWIFAPHPSKYWCAFFFPWHHWQELHASAPKKTSVKQRYSWVVGRFRVHQLSNTNIFETWDSKIQKLGQAWSSIAAYELAFLSYIDPPWSLQLIFFCGSLREATSGLEHAHRAEEKHEKDKENFPDCESCLCSLAMWRYRYRVSANV